MTKTLFATFDGEVLRPDEPVSLAPNTRVLLTIEAAEPDEAQATSFLRTARTLDLHGPTDWSSRVEDYLYGDAGAANG